MLALFLAALDDPADQQIFLSFYKKWRGLMYQVAFNILHEKYLAEDAVQNVFVDILGQISKLRKLGEGQAKGFAIVMARNKAVDILRQKRSVESWEDMEEDLMTMEIEIDESTRIFNQLPKLYADVLKLAGLGFKAGEIAEIQKKEVGTVYKQISRGKELWGEILQKEGYDGYGSN